MATIDGVPADLLPNLLTPAAWLAPQVAADYELSRYIYVGAVAAFFWDWMMAWSLEYGLFIKERLDTTKIVYAISRVATLIYLLLSFVFHISPIPDCHSYENAVNVFYLFAAPTTSFLFYKRVCAVYDRSRIITLAFGTLWLAASICTLVAPVGPTSQPIGATSYCLQFRVSPYAAAGIVANIIYIWLVFLAICWRVWSLATIGESGGRHKIASLTSGDGLSAFSEMLIQAGQSYYFFSAFAGILTLGLLFSGAITPSARAIATVPNLAAANAMGTFVFREIRRGIFASDPAALPPREGPPAHSHVFVEQDTMLREAETFRGTMWSTNENTYAPEPSSYDGHTVVEESRASMSKPGNKHLSKVLPGKKDGEPDYNRARSSFTLSAGGTASPTDEVKPPAYDSV